MSSHKGKENVSHGGQGKVINERVSKDYVDEAQSQQVQ
jgi:hypothetical protein